MFGKGGHAFTCVTTDAVMRKDCTKIKWSLYFGWIFLFVLTHGYHARPGTFWDATNFLGLALNNTVTAIFLVPLLVGMGKRIVAILHPF